jgi:SAM-dependent methyltransferase
MAKTITDGETGSRKPILFKGGADILKLFRIAKEKGYQATFDAIKRTLWGRYYRLSDRAFDRRYGVDTYTYAYPSDLTIESDNVSVAQYYEPTIVDSFARMLSEFPDDLSDFVFLDCGSGKGKALLLASHYNFKQVIGVEFAEELHDAAVRNIEIYESKHQRCVQIHAVCADATKFPLPEDNLVLFLNNPFGPQVMTDVVENLRHSYQTTPRKIFVIYENPWYREVFDRQDFLQLKSRQPFNWKLRMPVPCEFATFEST